METPSCPKTWLAESILVTIFCCLPFGIVGIVNAAKISTLFAEGKYDEAEHASRQAGKWTKIGFWVGLGCGVVYLIWIAYAAGTGEL